MENLDFIGRGWSFPPSFRKGNGTVDMLTGKEDIQSSIEILLSTSLGERVMLPEYGLNTERLLFDPISNNFLVYLSDLVKNAILYFEPRVKVNLVDVESVPEEGLVRIFIDYTVLGTNTRFNFVYPFYLEEGTDIRSLLNP